MASTGQNDLLDDFATRAIGPACTDFAARIGADEPSPLTGRRVGYEIALPSAMKDVNAKTVVVCAEPFDDEAFIVKASRPDMPDQLRQIALVRYESLRDGAERTEETDRLRAEVGNALEQLHQGLSNR